MLRHLIVALALLAPARAFAQDVFVAATERTVVGSIEESQGGTPAHLLTVANRSSVPVIVFGVSLSACENIRQSCGGHTTNVRVEPAQSRTVYRVERKLDDMAFSYRWTFSYHPDSGDARMIAMLRQNGVLADQAVMPAAPRNDVREVASMGPVPVPSVRAVVERGPITAVEPLAPLVGSREVDGLAEATSAIAPTRRFYVKNKSAYPIVVYSFNLASCLNVKQVCGRSPVQVKVPAGGRMLIARVDAQDKARRYSYDWTYDWHLDTADTRVAAALRERGTREGVLGRAENVAVQAAPALPVATDVSERFRFRVARESILGSTQVKGAAVQATGACIDPGELRKLELDTAITAAPAVQPRLTERGILLPSLPDALRDAGTGPVRVVARWVVEVDGGTVPGSASIVESPSGLVSVRTCGAVLSAHLEPARDASGQAVRTWVELPFRIQR